MKIFRSRVWFNAETSIHRESNYRRRSPLVRKWLRKYGLNASDVMKQETAGRLTKQDVEAYMAQLGEATLLKARTKQP
ncbi:hypothetical protein SAMN05421771_2429 [Granulicella pectinivorans]|uniref:Peripheral subunit-binding (PSBD) domain-containing protein n=1 Tax=Granulicella pectinivorans TaxID=474950 RepID=A0A1I6MDY8_9BACT|nr:hypothetical protein SAMN05421771_2429 [Granulicella pectinivorans]